MLSRIIVAFDGSEDAREAFANALLIAMATKSKIVGFYALEPAVAPVAMADPTLGVDLGPALTFDNERIQAERQQAERALSSLEDECGDKGVKFVPVIAHGRLLDAITEEAGADDLIAVGRKGRFARSGVGSTTRALVAHAPCPVMVVTGAMRPIQRVMAIYDSGGESKKAVSFAADLAKAAGWPLSILAAAGRGYSLDEARERAAELAPDATVISLGPDEQQDEAKLVEYAADRAGPSLLVMGAYTHSWVYNLLFGSVTAKVLEKVGGPVVLVH
jgi:nucleotide-binding universal stress UspA family protein